MRDGFPRDPGTLALVAILLLAGIPTTVAGEADDEAEAAQAKPDPNAKGKLASALT